MVKLLADNREYSLNKKIYHILGKLKFLVTQKGWDGVILVDGAERSGKSTLAMQMAKMLDPSFGIDDIYFDPIKFRDGLLAAPEFKAVVFDEARRGLGNRRSMSNINVTLTNLLAEIGQRHLFIIVVLPTFFDLDKNIAIWRSRYLFHVYTNGSRRGFVMAFNAKLKKKLYLMGKRLYSYAKPKSMFNTNFSSFSVVSPKLYDKKKRESLLDHQEEGNEKEREKELNPNSRVNIKERVLHKVIVTTGRNLMEKQGLGLRETSRRMGIDASYLKRHLVRAKLYPIQRFS